MQTFLGIIIGLIILMLLVLLHELGHFLAAIKNKVEVKEFAIGFPPRAKAFIKTNGKWQKLAKKDWQKPQKTTVVTLNYLPLGGFCAMKDEYDSADTKNSFGSATFWQKTQILFAGVIMNWLTAIVILTFVTIFGMPKILHNQFAIPADLKTTTPEVSIKEIAPNSPASKADLKPGDQILKINQKDILSTEDVISTNNQNANQEINLTIRRNSEIITKKIKLNHANSEYKLGISMQQQGKTIYYSTWSAPIVATGLTLQITAETLKGIGTIFTNLFTGLISQFNSNPATKQAGQVAIGRAGESVAGPIGILGFIFPAFVSAGVKDLALLTAIISISLACMNILPIPALDGGRWLLIAIYKLRKKPLTKDIEQKIVGRAFLALMFLFVLITILDIIKFF